MHTHTYIDAKENAHTKVAVGWGVDILKKYAQNCLFGWWNEFLSLKSVRLIYISTEIVCGTIRDRQRVLCAIASSTSFTDELKYCWRKSSYSHYKMARFLKQFERIKCSYSESVKWDPFKRNCWALNVPKLCINLIHFQWTS